MLALAARLAAELARAGVPPERAAELALLVVVEDESLSYVGEPDLEDDELLDIAHELRLGERRA